MDNLHNEYLKSKINKEKLVTLVVGGPNKYYNYNTSILDEIFFKIKDNFIRKGFYYLIESMRLLENENIRLDLRTNIPSYLDIKKIPKCCKNE